MDVKPLNLLCNEQPELFTALALMLGNGEGFYLVFHKYRHQLLLGCLHWVGISVVYRCYY